MKNASEDLPPCIWCGGEAVKELGVDIAAENERWFHCTYCHRVFCVRFTPDRPPGAEGKNGPTMH